MKHAIPFFK